MKFILGKTEWKTLERGQEKCYLLTNGLGGFSSLSIIGSNARNDHALLMASVKAPNQRVHLITNVEEKVCIEGKEYDLSSQQYVTYTKNKEGYNYLNSFEYDYLPVWTYQVEGVEIIKTIVMVHNENSVGLQYKIKSHSGQKVSLKVEPRFRFTLKDEMMFKGQTFDLGENDIKSNGYQVYFNTNAKVKEQPLEYIKDLYYEQDARDGRDSVGGCMANHHLEFDETNDEAECFVVYSMKPNEEQVESLIEKEVKRLKDLELVAGINNPIGKMLARNANQYVTYRESTKGKTIIAGYPFFGDWGRDTMIALLGCTIATKQFEDTKSILRSFMKYTQKGLMPNMFPEGDNNPFYNTVDASLLFINAVYEYYNASGDKAFIEEAMETIEEIIAWYKKGTDYHIKMDEDALIMAGAELEQLTWMDVRFGDILPTPRHGKPVEINAYWYNALKIAEEFSNLLGKNSEEYGILADKVKQSFLAKFWNEEEGCLKDVISGTKADVQIRCNQIWSVSLSYCMLEKEQALLVVKKVFEKLYTPIGLRSLEMDDEAFHYHYGGSQFKRDMAYHQGTVWGFPLGAYYIAYLKWAEDKKEAKATVERQLQTMMSYLQEGCLGHIAEIYDGAVPNESQGCFAQAWSVGEIVRVYAAVEKHEN